MIFIGAGATDTEKPFVLYENLLAGGSLSGTVGLAPGAAYANVLGPQTFDFWRPSVIGGQWICTLPVPVEMDCVCFAAHNLGRMVGNWQIQTAPDLDAGYSVTRNISAAELTANGAAALCSIFAPRMVQRLRFFLSLGVGEIPQVGIAFAGKRLIFPGDVQAPYVPANEAVSVDFSANITMGGHFAGGTITRQSVKQDVAFSPLARDFVQGDLVPFSKAYREGRTFFFAGSPSYMPADLGYVWRGDGAGELRPAWRQGGRFADVKMAVDGYGA